MSDAYFAIKRRIKGKIMIGKNQPETKQYN